MYSDKTTVNVITSMLIAKGVSKVVVCPGSRNIPLIHNFSESQAIKCFSVTDERSAAFFALGLSLACCQPVAVCVTSGSALLNVAPAVAEAFYRHVPLVVISADRPMEWIDRQDGQTMIQFGALEKIVKRQIDISDVAADDRIKLNHASLCLNATLNDCMNCEPGPVHINVHLDEPLFNFNTSRLPQSSDIQLIDNYSESCGKLNDKVLKSFIHSQNRMIVIGQLATHDIELDKIVERLSRYFFVLCEPLASTAAVPFDSALTVIGKKLEAERIDLLFSLGGTFVSKRLKSILRSAEVMEHYEINETGIPHDMFMHQTGVVKCSVKAFLQRLLTLADESLSEPDPMRALFMPSIKNVAVKIDEFIPPYSSLWAVKEFESSLHNVNYEAEVHYANSMAVRLACLYANGRYVWCNRGINGIEGSVSTAAGFSLASKSVVFCVVGDLSFFYDQNALWNNHLRGNFRVMLLNNGGGNIFRRLKGLDCSSQSMPFIVGSHKTNARGICEQNNICYLSATNREEFNISLMHFLKESIERPVVFEVFTDAVEDSMALDALDEYINKHQI